VILSDLCADVEIDGHFLTVGNYKTDIDRKRVALQKFQALMM